MIRNKKISVTGGAGFIGSTVIRSLIDSNTIVAFDNLSRNSIKNSPDLLRHPNFTMVEGDVLAMAATTREMAGSDIVIHAAGVAGIDTKDLTT